MKNFLETRAIQVAMSQQNDWATDMSEMVQTDPVMYRGKVSYRAHATVAASENQVRTFPTVHSERDGSSSAFKDENLPQEEN